MKVLFITNIPSPYRVEFFNGLGQVCDLTVCFERQQASDREVNWKWCGSIRYYREIIADVKPFGTDRSIGLGIRNIIKELEFDRLIITGYASPAVIVAINYCKKHRIPYFLESDGGFFKTDKIPVLLLKKFLLKGACGHFTTCEEHIHYLQTLGIPVKKIHKYPFTSLKQIDILPLPLSMEEKLELRKLLGIKEKKIVLSVGQFIYRKGYDILLEAAQHLNKDIGIYIIGGVPPLKYSQMKEVNNLTHVHFVGFMEKEKLKTWYCAADCFVLPTREDVWGLVINEAMANGLPVVTTDKCIAGSEMIENGLGGYIVPVDNSGALVEKINSIVLDSVIQQRMAIRNLQIISKYTTERMVEEHIRVLSSWEV